MKLIFYFGLNQSVPEWKTRAPLKTRAPRSGGPDNSRPLQKSFYKPEACQQNSRWLRPTGRHHRFYFPFGPTPERVAAVWNPCRDSILFNSFPVVSACWPQPPANWFRFLRNRRERTFAEFSTRCPGARGPRPRAQEATLFPKENRVSENLKAASCDPLLRVTRTSKLSGPPKSYFRRASLSA
jgi:hypothetical protein